MHLQTPDAHCGHLRPRLYQRLEPTVVSIHATPIARRAWSISLWSILAVGCGNAVSDPSAVFDIQGGWNYSENLQNSTALSTCIFLGTLTFLQQEAVFNGTYTRTRSCIGVSTSEISQQNGSISGGLFIKDFIQFQMAGCDYRGVIVNDTDPPRLSGSVLCQKILPDGTALSSSGTWSADKLTEQSSS